MKIWSCIILSILPALTFCQITRTSKLTNRELASQKFTLTFSTFNHSERSRHGTTTYILTESKIEIINNGLFTKKENIIFTKTFADSLNPLKNLLQIRLDTLEEFYTNHCIMIVSGNEYFLRFSKGSKKKNITLHHYYLKQIDDIVDILNSFLPTNFHFSYLPKDTKQDCTP